MMKFSSPILGTQWMLIQRHFLLLLTMLGRGRLKTDLEGGGKYTNRLNVSLENGVVFETLFIPNSQVNETLYVAFPCGGRSSGRTIFNYWSWSRHLDGDMLCVEDPSYKKIFSKREGTRVVCWFFGEENNSYLLNLASLLQELRECAGYTRIVFLGHSAGGYASLFIANEMKGTSAIVCAPQIIIEKWGHYKNYPEIHAFAGKDPFGRFDLRRVIENRSSNFLIMYNGQDALDTEQINHLAGFEVVDSVTKVGNVVILRGDSLCRPAHRFIFDPVSLPALSELVVSMETAKPWKTIKALGRGLLAYTEQVHENKAKSILTGLQGDISNELLRRSWNQFEVRCINDRLEIYFRIFGARFRYYVCLVDSKDEIFTIGVHAYSKSMTLALKSMLLKVASSLKLSVREAAYFTLFKKLEGSNSVHNEFYKLLDKTHEIFFLTLMRETAVEFNSFLGQPTKPVKSQKT